MKTSILLTLFLFILLQACGSTTTTDNQIATKKDKNSDADTCKLTEIVIKKVSEPYYGDANFTDCDGKTGGVEFIYYTVEFSNKQIQDKINNDITKAMKNLMLFYNNSADSLQSLDKIASDLFVQLTKDVAPTHIFSYAQVNINNPYIFSFGFSTCYQSCMGESPMCNSYELNYDLTTGNRIDAMSEIDKDYYDEVYELILPIILSWGRFQSLDEIRAVYSVEAILSYSSNSYFDSEGLHFGFSENLLRGSSYEPGSVTLSIKNVAKYLSKESIVLKMWNDKSLQK